MRSRSWRWLRTRVLGLLDVQPTYVLIGDRAHVTYPTRLARALYPDKL